MDGASSIVNSVSHYGDMSRQQPGEHETNDASTNDDSAAEANTDATRARWRTATVWTVLAVVAVIVGVVIGVLAHSGEDDPHDGEPLVVATQRGSGMTVTLPGFYGDNMVFQRDEPLTVRGSIDAAPSTHAGDRTRRAVFDAFNVRAISADGVKEAVTHVGDDGSFTAEFTPTEGSTTPYVIESRDGSTPVHALANDPRQRRLLYNGDPPASPFVIDVTSSR